ncbi:hypothetical protein [Klebsiella variicola]|uniref:hypothetical protein n=1 Tax=Klebsiella variicola TaxID=244366 RepID=UPI0028B3E563|nr:hypothetical protein [Klebsiella variicola]MDT7007337.1 hypothetical protein [Klebsiella variicola]MDT7029208.1 hypothetical protein [Klebsiella variicola]
MTSKLNINWLNKCRCGNRMHTVETVRGSHVRLFEDDAVKCNSCGREGVIQTCDGIATVLWETDEERAEGVTMTKSTITRERLEWLSHISCRDDIEDIGGDEIRELASMALAAIDSKPFAYIIQDKYERERGVEGHLSRSHVSKYVSQEDINEHEITCIPLYRHAQQPVVPEEMTIMDACKFVQDMRLFDDVSVIVMCTWNACRAAMLNGGKS